MKKINPPVVIVIADGDANVAGIVTDPITTR